MERYYDNENKRLIYLGGSATPAFWDSHWDTESFRNSVVRAKDDRCILETLRKYIPDEKGTVLEGGCGRGQIACCMHGHGYESIGIDFAKKTVEKIRRVFPEVLPYTESGATIGVHKEEDLVAAIKDVL